MTHHIPKKPSQEFLDYINDNYTYIREKGQVINNKRCKPAIGLLNGYLYSTVNVGKKKRNIKTHHLVWYFEYGGWPTSCLDHIDGDKTNNHHTNLRQVTQRENAQHYCKTAKTASKYLGVSQHKGAKKWQGSIRVASKLKHLGYFDCELEAARAYDKALVGQGLDPVNVKIMRNKERMQKVMEFINDTD